jgi:hypothetical protein
MGATAEAVSALEMRLQLIAGFADDSGFAAGISPRTIARHIQSVAQTQLNLLICAVA